MNDNKRLREVVKLYKEKYSKVFSNLYKDEIEKREKNILSFLVVFSFCFTFLFFGPFEIAVTNKHSLLFTPREIFFTILIVATSIYLVIALIVSLIKGEIYYGIINCIFTITLAGYIQGNFLNSNMGDLDGTNIIWYTETINMIKNTGIWLLIGLILYIILKFDNKIWVKTVRFMSFMLIIMQMVAFLSLSISGAFDISKSRNYLMNQNDMFTYSKENNTIIFLVDTLDYDYIEMILSEDPDFFSEMTGFTSYTNTISEHVRTIPAINYLLTNYQYEYDIPYGVSGENSWNQENKNMLRELNNADYDINIYSDMRTVFGDSNPKGMVSNIESVNTKIEHKNVIYSLLRLSAYRYSPLMMKPFLWTYTDAINEDTVMIDGVEKQYVVDETIFLEGIDEFTLTEKNFFKFYHFNGSHVPYTLLEDGTKSEIETDVVQQTKGVFNILYQAFEEMKRLEIYEDATIIVMADHGLPFELWKPLQKEIRIGLFYKPSGSGDMPLKYSKAPISFNNLPATILKSVGISYEDYGVPIDEVGEDEEITRYFYKPVLYGREEDAEWNPKKEDRLHIYEIIGDASNFDNWELIEDKKLEHRGS